MLEYSDFYDIATYGNNHAYDYWCEFQHSKANGVMTNTILVLIENLREDDTKEANEWIEKIRREIIS